MLTVKKLRFCNNMDIFFGPKQIAKVLQRASNNGVYFYHFFHCTTNINSNFIAKYPLMNCLCITKCKSENNIT